MAQLMVHRDVLKNFGRLPVQVQKRIADFVDRFRDNPNDPALRLHSLKESMLDPKVCGAELPNGFRAILVAPEKGDTFIMVHVDKHDDAYAWAKNKRFEVHGATGVFQVFDSETVAAKTEASGGAPTGGVEYPLAHLSDDELFRAGVPQPLIPAVKAVSSDEGLEALADYLPPDCRDVLHGLAAGMTLDEALNEMLGIEAPESAVQTVEGPGDFSAIAAKPNYDLVVVDDEEDFKKVLAASLEEWRVFLHPYQRRLVEWRTNGPMNITGAAGTGKTVALVHRAVHLAQTYPGERILLTTFTTNLSITLKEFIRQLDPGAGQQVEVTNLHALARTICTRAGWKGRIANERELADIWEEVWEEPALEELPMSREELVAEHEAVIEPNGIDDEDTYLTTVRSGRPRISRRQRRQAWPVFVAFQRGVKRRNLLTFEGAIHQARLAVEQGRVPQYEHVLVDEAQDFSLEALRLIRALSPVDGDRPDPLCLAGDGHQRIYRKKFPMSRAGIDIRGRSRRLKVNYRTSEQIRTFAQGMLEGMDIDNFEDGAASTVGDRSVFLGPDPLVQPCGDETEEARAVVEWVRDLTENGGLASHEICVTPFKRSIMDALNSGGFPTYHLRPREMDPGRDEPGIRLGTMKRIKGLEFRAVAMACAGPDDPMNHMTDSNPLSRCERYVASTRAREHLLVTTAENEAADDSAESPADV